MRLLLLLLLVGCGPHDQSYWGRPIYPGVQAVLYGNDLDHIQQIAATIAHITSWEVNQQASAPPVNMFVIPDPIACGVSGATGCVLGDVVTIWRGTKNDLPALSHDLYHLARITVPYPDPQHLDPRWGAWDISSNATSADIRSHR